MSRRMNVCATVLLALLELTTSAMVLPRPPSSPNHIRQDQELSARKSLEGKSLHGIPRNTNVERPDTEDYRYRFANVRLTRPFHVIHFFFSFLSPRPRTYRYHIPRPSHATSTIHFRAYRIANSFESDRSPVNCYRPIGRKVEV